MRRHVVTILVLLLWSDAGGALDCPPATEPSRKTVGCYLSTDGESLEDCSDGWRADGCGRLEPDGTRTPVGRWTEYYPTGQPAAAGEYQGDERHGMWTGWHRDGQRFFRGRYRDGDRIGHWDVWYESGIKRHGGRYERDLRHGLWRFWNTAGLLEREGAYDLGRPVGSWSVRSEDGKLVSAEPPPEPPFFPCRGPLPLENARVFSRPTLELGDVWKDETTSWATVRLTNPHSEPACVYGYGRTSLFYGIERWTGERWQEHGTPFWCGVGAGPIQLPPGESERLTVDLGTDPRPFRIVVSALRSIHSSGAFRIVTPKTTVENLATRATPPPNPGSERELREAATRASLGESSERSPLTK